MERHRSGGAEAGVAGTAARVAAVRARRLALPGAWAPALRAAWRATWVSRLVVWAAGVGALAAWGTSARAPGFDPGGLVRGFGTVGDALVAPAARWDSVWYLAIAQDGYADGARAAFFPLYPLLVRAVGVLGSTLVAGVLVSCACLVVALAALHRLTELELGPEAARWTVTGLAFSPMAFFGSAVYSESLFLALSAAAALAARRGRWGWAAGLGALAAATRSAGVLVLVLLAGLALDARRTRAPWAPRAGGIAALAVVPLGLAAFCGALALGGHDAWAPFHAQATWLRSWAGPFGGVQAGARAGWDGLRQVLSGQRAHVFFTAAGGDPLAVGRQNLSLLVWLVLGAVALAGAARRLPRAYAGYALAALALPLSYPVAPEPLMSLPRFELVLFPLWMWWGAWLARHPRARPWALGVSAAGLVAYTAQFATWHWVA